MFILHDILGKFKNEFVLSRKDNERAEWFIHTLLAIIIPFTSAKTSNLLRCLHHLFGFTGIGRKRYYTFMASPKLPWQTLWQGLWQMIPNPLTNDWLLLALDDYINPKNGKKSLDATISLIMPLNKISPNIHGHKMSLPLDC